MRMKKKRTNGKKISYKKMKPTPKQIEMDEVDLVEGNVIYKDSAKREYQVEPHALVETSKKTKNLNLLLHIVQEYLSMPEASMIDQIYKGYMHCRIKPIDSLEPRYFLDEIRVFPFETLEYIQWHMISHCVADHFIQPNDPPMVYSHDKGAEEYWTDLRSTVQCRWSEFDLIGLLQQGVSKEEILERWCSEYYNSSDPRSKGGKSGCNGCLSYMQDRFIECYKVFNKMRKSYIQRVSSLMECYKELRIDCIINAQDSLSRSGVEGLKEDVKSKMNMPEDGRLFIHLKNGTKYYYCYIIEKDEDIYKAFFLALNRFERKNQIRKYWLSTVYGIKTSTVFGVIAKAVLNHVEVVLYRKIR